MLFHVDNIKIKQKNPVIRYKIANVLTEFTMLKPNKIKKKRNRNSQILLFRYGRGDRIRTCGILVPNQVRYQTAPRPDELLYYTP